MICQYCGVELLEPAETGELNIDSDIAITINYLETCQDCADLIESCIIRNLLTVLPAIGASTNADRA